MRSPRNKVVQAYRVPGCSHFHTTSRPTLERVWRGGFLYNTGMTKQADLIAYVFDGQPHLLSGDLLRWMEASSRFTGFIDTYRDKIRKKVRLARDPETALDLCGELEAAWRLLDDRRLNVAYEPYASAKRRGPDLAITYRTNLVFNIEVARLRVEEGGAARIDIPRKEERLLRIFLDKLGQMQPGMANLLVIQTREELARSVDLGRLMQQVKLRAEGKDPAFFALGRYASRQAFNRDFLHLSGTLLWAASVQMWINKQARPGLPENVARLVCARLVGASAD